MRKRFLWLGIPLLLLVGAGIFARARLDRWLDDNRQSIEDRAEAALGRKLGFERLRASLFPTLSVRIDGLRIGDDPAYARGDFVTARRVDVGVRLLPLLRGRVEIGRVLLRSPRITLIQDEQGRNVDSLGRAASAPTDPERPAEKSSTPPLWIALLDVRNGELRWIDRRIRPAQEILLSDIDIRASDIDPAKAVDFDIALALLGAKAQNLEIEGSLGPLDPENPDATKLDLDLRIDPLDLARLTSLPQLAAVLPPSLRAAGPLHIEAHSSGTRRQAEFELKIDATAADIAVGDAFASPAGKALSLRLAGRLDGDDLQIGHAVLQLADSAVQGEMRLKRLQRPQAEFSLVSNRFDASSLRPGGVATSETSLRELTLNGTLQTTDDGAVLSAALRSPGGMLGGSPYQDLELDLSRAGERSRIDRLAVHAFDGDVVASASHDASDPARPALAFRAELDGLRAEQYLAGRRSPLAETLRGRLSADFSAQGRGRDAQTLKRALAGKGSMQVLDGRLIGVNLADEALGKITGVPGLATLVSPSLRQKYPQVFGGADTEFERIDVRLDLGGGWLRISDLRLAAHDYAILGDGRISLDGDLDMATRMQFSAGLSADLVANAEPAALLLDDQGRFEIPVQISGRAPKIHTLPDLAYIAKNVSRRALGGLIDRFLPGAQPAPGGDRAPSRNPADDLVRGLGDLLGR